MNAWIESVKMNDQFSNVLEITGINGARRQYLEYDGTFIVGRVITAFDPECKYSVTFFLPFMDGLPVVLKVADR